MRGTVPSLLDLSRGNVRRVVFIIEYHMQPVPQTVTMIVKSTQMLPTFYIILTLILVIIVAGVGLMMQNRARAMAMGGIGTILKVIGFLLSTVYKRVVI